MRRLGPLPIAMALTSAACIYVDRPVPVVRGPVTLVAATGTSAHATMVFVSARDTDDKWSKSQLYLGDATGAIATNITNDANSNWAPSLSPDGTRIVFASSRNPGGLFSMNIDGSDVRRLTTQVWSPSHPRWSSADVIAFSGNAEGPRTALWTMSPPGGVETQLTTPGPDEADDGGLAFVDGGKAIVFSRYDRNTQDRDLYIVPTDGASAPVRLTQTSKITETEPVTSHDGRMLAYRATDMSGGDTHEWIVVRTVGTWATERRIVLPPPVRYNVSGIDFTADDRGLVFGADASDVGGNLVNLHGEIWSIDLDGTQLVRLSKNAAYDGAPVSLLSR